MRIVMPDDYVVIEQEEMMYLDGGGFGRQWYKNRDNVAGFINTVATALSGGMSVYSVYTIRRLIADRSWISRVVCSAVSSFIGTVS